jgi:hypothetical protein
VPGDQSLVEGTTLTVSATASDPDLPKNSLTFSLDRPPDGMTIDPTTGAITWIPGGGQLPAFFSVMVRVEDDGMPALSAMQSFNITVKANEPPVANPDSVVRKSGRGIKAGSSTLIANDTDPDGQSLVLVSVNTPSVQGGTVTLADGWVYYQPPSGSDPPLDSFTYVVRDPSGTTATGTVTVSISSPSANPTLNILSVTGGFPNPAIVRFAGIPGREYTIQSSPVFSPPVWTTLGRATVGPNGIAEFTDHGAATEPTVFYRALQP